MPRQTGPAEASDRRPAARVPSLSAPLSAPSLRTPGGLTSDVRASVRVRLARTSLVHAPAVLVTGLAVALWVGAGPRVTTVALLGVIAVHFRPSRAGRALLRVPSQLTADIAIPIGLVAASVAILPTRVAGASVMALRQGLLLVIVGNLAHAVSTLIARRVSRPPRIVVVSDRSLAAVAAERWSGRPGAHVVGSLVLDDEADESLAMTEADDPAAGLVAVVPSIDDLVEQVERLHADLVVVVPGSRLSAREVRLLSWRLEHTGVAVALAGVLDAVAPHRLGFGSVGGQTVVLSGSSRPSVVVRAVKWVVDRVGAAVLLVVGAPVLAAAALAIRLDSKGPAFFRQERVGMRGRTFTMLKLRTMYDDADAQLRGLAEDDEGHGPLFKIRRDPRITRVGALLRKSSLDELPQLVNVLRGEMSLVGPRPALPREVATYDEHVARRLVVRPGMTGLWQVSGRSDLDWAASVELDLHYADNYRLTDDLLIGLRTVEAVARARGAY